MDQAHEANAVVEEASQPYVGQWNRLVSTTNWEKGRIIHEWRSALVSAGAATTEYSDEAWSRTVGAVSGQHVGRLRRVYERFGDVHTEYEGLFWSHFQSALDWDDAEMWLEGSLQSGWSVSQMRRQRWEALGGASDAEPSDDQVIQAEMDEDVSRDDAPSTARDKRVESDNLVVSEHDFVAEAVSPAGPDFGDEPDVPPADSKDTGASIYADEPEAVPFVRPFENLAQMPDDLSEAFESFKLAILRHKTDGWQQISREDTLISLDALKELVLAPSADNA